MYVKASRKSESEKPVVLAKTLESVQVLFSKSDKLRRKVNQVHAKPTSLEASGSPSSYQTF